MDSQRPVENGVCQEEVSSTSLAMSKTTTISTIAVQSGGTRIVIALLHCGDWINLKILEITPELTKLGDTLEEALVLQKAHDEVLRQLQNKQSPVEELLRQADQLIATQKPRAEVYAAMAESLGRAWKDINSNLELRKQILDLNVLYHTKAQEFFEKMELLEASCKDTVVPIEIEAVKEFLTTIHDQRRALLESLMGALQAGNTLLEKLKELGAEGTLDSRPERIRSSVSKAISQVQGWLDGLHVKRQILEATFNRRKTQLEQCLALAILAADLRELEDTIQNRRELLANSNEQGDSSSSAELLLHEHKKLLPEAKQLQDRALKITKATEQLVASGCFAGEPATAQSYVVLSATSDYLADLQSRETLLERVIAFFRSAQTVLTKLDQLEIQLTATALPKTSPQLAQLHSQCSKAIEEATAAPLAEGYAILDIVGRGASGAEGVRHMVEELENKKITLDGLCTAHKEENVRINQSLNNFLDRHNDIYNWLVTIAEAFLQGHQDMGSDLPMAKDFYDLHSQLLTDLQTKGNEINALLLTLPPILEYLEDNQRRDIDTKVEQLHERWMNLKNILESRMELSRIYVKFHMEADIVNKEMDKLDDVLLQNKDNVDEQVLRNIEEKFESIVPLYQCAKNTGITFINQSKMVSEPHLDTKRARLCVESVLERLAGRQLVVTKNWQTFHTEVTEKKEVLVKLEQTMTESVKTINWVSKLDSQLYPVITTSSTRPGEIANYLENKLASIVPDLKKAQAEVAQKLRTAESLILKASTADEKTTNIKNTLHDLNQRLTEKCSDYQILLQVLIGYFRTLEDIDKKAENFNARLEKTDYPKDVSSVESLIREHESCRQTIIERLRFAQTECDQIADRITKQEPENAAEEDTNKLQHVLELRRGEFENQWRQRHDSLESHRQFCIFDNNLHQVNESIDDLNRQIKNLQGQYGESSANAKATSQSFDYIENSIKGLEPRVSAINQTGDKLLAERHTQSSQIHSELTDLRDRWTSLKNQVEATRSLINLSIPYFEQVEKADEWFREGSKLLVTIARKSTTVKSPDEAEKLLKEISDFLKPGEEIQNVRMEKISELARKLYGPEQTKHAPLLHGNNEMIESFSAITKELKTLAENLRAAEEERIRLERDRKQALLAAEAKKLEEARLAEEIRISEEARKAEEARLLNERRMAEEARFAEETRLAKERIRKEELRLEEERRLAAEARLAEQARQAEDRQKAEEIRLAEEARLAEERRKLEEERRMLEETKLVEATRIENERRHEEARRAEEAERAEKYRRAEDARRAEEAQRAERMRLAEESRIAELRRQQEAERMRLEQLSKLEEAKILEGKQRAEEAKLEAQKAEEARLAEEARIEELRRLQEAEKKRLEELRVAENARILDEKRKAEQAKLEAQRAEKARLEEEARIAELRRQQETERVRLEELRQAEEIRILDEKRKAEQARLEAQKAEQARIVEEGRIEELRRQQEAERVRLEELRKAEEARILDEKRNAEQARLDAQRLEQTRLEEEARISELRRQQEAERIRLEDMRRAEENRILEENRRAEQARLEQQKAELVRQQEAKKIRYEELERAAEARILEEKQKAEPITLETGTKVHKKHTVEITELTDVQRIEIQTSASKRIPSPIPIIEYALEKPVFTSPLSNAVIQEGSKFTFICQVTGYPTPTITWYKAGIPIQNNPDYRTNFENGICSLTIEETFAEDSARYTCRATNAGGQDETTALLTVKETEPQEVLLAPTFVKHLEASTAREGSTFQFECRVEGNPLPTVQWYKDTVCIDNSSDYIITYNNGDAVLKFEHVYLEDKADYTCKACNQMGIAQSTANLVVTPLEPTESPMFISPLSNVMARAGQKIKLECEISGLPLPVLSWSHNGKPVKETRENKLQLENNKATLIIYEAFPKDAGTYSVSAKNIAGEATSSCSVSVKGRLPTETSDSEMASDMEPIKPSIQLPLSNTSVQEGNRIRLDCVIVGQPEPEVIWYHNDRPVKESTDFQLLFQGDRCSLVIQEALPEDAGEYKVVALNSAGEASSQCMLSVIPVSESEVDAKPKEEKTEPTGTPPKFSKLLADVLISEGDKVILEGCVTGVPRPEIKWLLNNLPITDTEHFAFSHDDEGNVKLQIANVRPDDKGVYTVKATNSLGEVKCFAQLIVKSLKPPETVKHEEVKQAPEFKEVFHDRSAFLDTHTKFECIVTGKPTPKIKWLYNGDAISGKDFLISTSGDRQVLAIPNLKREHSGTITCVAENEIGKASCAASLVVQSPSSITLPEFEAAVLPPFQATMQMPLISPLTPLRTEKMQHIESSYIMNREVLTQTSTSQTSKIISSSSAAPEPHVEEHKIIAQNEQVFKQVNQEAPEIKESHRIEEFHKVGKEPPVIHEKSSSTYTIGEMQGTQKQVPISELKQVVHKPALRVRPPKFITPVIGKIVDQDVDIVLEGILDGQPTPQVTWTRNGAELKPSEKVKISWSLNKATVEIKNVKTDDAGRYSCTATNEGGTAVSTADLVVRKTIFPPVFGRRLQAQVIKKGDRVIMEVEVTGTPEPTVTWFRDGVPVEDSLKDGYKVKTMGQCHTLVIEKAELNLTGRFMVRAVNSGGEAQSIADIAVFEPAPDTMVEVVKTVVFEDVRKHETLTSAADKISSSVTRSEPLHAQITKKEMPSSTLLSDQTTHSIASKSEMTSSEEQRVSQEMKKMRLEYTAPEIPMPKPIIPRDILVKETEYEICDQPLTVQNEVTVESAEDVQDGIETSSISKQSSLQYFVQKIKGSDNEEIAVPKEISIPEPLKPEIYKKFETIEQPKKEIEIPIRVEQKIAPPVPPKPEPSKVREALTSTPVTNGYTSTSSIQQSAAPVQYQTFASTQHVTEDFNLQREPPAEICYAKKQEGVKKRDEVAERIKRLSECQKELPLHEIPTGAVKIFPSAPKTEHIKEKEGYTRQTEHSFEQSSFQSQSSSSYQSHTFGSSTPYVETIHAPKIEFDRPVSTTSSTHSTTERQFHSRPHSVLSGTEPSQEGLLMEKQWAHKLSESHIEKSWPPLQYEEPKMQPSWSVHSTLEKKWTPSEEKTEQITREQPILVDDVQKQHYIAEVSNLGNIIDNKHISTEIVSSSQSLQSEKIIEVRNVRPSEIIKSWPPTHVEPIQPPRVIPTLESLPVRPISVQDITDEVYLEPGPPPEIGYAQPPAREKCQSYEREKHLEQARVPPSVVRTLPPPQEWVIPPPLPPKQALPQAPPLPAKPIKHVEPPKKTIEVRSAPFQKFPDLEPFPFKPDTQKPRHTKVGPPPTPSKFVKGKFTDSDYESDFESARIPTRWKPCMSDTEESSYRRVPAPRMTHIGRSRSQECEPLPPSQFDKPPRFEGPPRPEINFEEFRGNKKVTEVKKMTKHVRDLKRTISPPVTPACIPQVKKPESPKVKHKIVQDGYMADTDEPFRQQELITTEYSEDQRSDYKQFSKSSEQYVETQKISTHKPRVCKFPVRKFTSSVSSPKEELIATPIITRHTSEQIIEQRDKHIKVEPFPFKADAEKPRKPVCVPPPSPSKFVRGEFRESEYESDYESRIPSVWASEEPTYRPVHPNLTPTQQHTQYYGKTPTPPTEFDNPPHLEGPPRPKFEPIEKFRHDVKPASKPFVHKPKAISAASKDSIIAKPFVLQPGSPPEIRYASGPKKTQYYKSTVSAPYTNAIQTETSNVVHFDESTERCHRTMSVQQTHKVIKFGDQHKQQVTKLEPFPYQPEPERTRRSTSVPPPPTPSKFQPGEFRESDYESEVESTKIKPKWTPGGTETGSLRYRKVRAPAASRSSSVPAPKERVVTPLEFDTQPPAMPSKISITDITDGQTRHESMYNSFTKNKSNQIMKRSHSFEPVLHPGTPPEYGYATDHRIKSTATKIASQHMDSMTHAFKSKTQKFVTDIMEDVGKQKTQKPAKNGIDGDAQVYREESRAAQYGTKHVDPDTGLIYFKYDFGYEFGIILPGEGKQVQEVPVPKKTIIEPPKRTSDIEMPVYHEKTAPTNHNATPKFKPKKFTPGSKSAKWDPTSESEMSEYEGEAKKTNNLLPGSRWDPSSCSPVSLSPSLPSTSPAFNNTFAGSGRKGAETPPSCPSTPGSTHGKVGQGQIRAPMFITPLRDIAVVCGQAAKFECIVQSEPTPSILWSKNGRIIENSLDHNLHYRNGVCRLTISNAYPEDAGTYTCTATNSAGTTNTNAALQVPGERRSQYIK
ncbi:unnamed protein product [Phaedon cochleariae]|uniref:Ig-like domain-containing protein n=1 Tax=Phaedon cochleariae TaxID=80249 RepID=A0A9N9X556_PHACE|nr:unnamed protein product [Phaedon cochleariae]